MKKKLIIDTDPGVDDAMAIQLALNSPEFEILGLTTVFGNVDIDLTTVNALRLIDLANKPVIPVAKGAAKPLFGEFKGGVPFVHGDDGQGNTFRPASHLQPIDISAEDFIIQQVLQFPNEVTIATLGPLTNLALALEKNPQIQHLVKEVIIMGGNAFCAGNATPVAEANILCDPEAADMVFGAAWPMTLIGLDVTHKVFLPMETLEEISKGSSPINQHVTASYLFYQDFFRKANKIEGSFIHDSSVIAYLLNQNFFKTISCPIRVETSDCISRGKTWPSLGDSDDETRNELNPWKNRPKVNIAVEVNGESIIELLKERLY